MSADIGKLSVTEVPAEVGGERIDTDALDRLSVTVQSIEFAASLPRRPLHNPPLGLAQTPPRGAADGGLQIGDGGKAKDNRQKYDHQVNTHIWNPQILAATAVARRVF